MGLYHLLKQYGESDYYPFHMPGHKRCAGALQEVRGLDITEVEGFDNLHHAEGILLEAQKRAAALYGSEDTYYLVNGSTAGILAAISACVKPGGKLLLARNSHKAAYHAAEIRQLKTVYVYPFGSIRPEDVRAALEENRDTEAVFLTSPTYEGVVSDAARIAEIAHSFGVPLIVDEAHGAHFGFHPYFPENSVKLGADIVIHSLHKTLPSLTQTALLHRNGRLVSRDRIEKFLNIYQSSSPSYVLMASMDECVSYMETYGKDALGALANRLEDFAEQVGYLKHIKLVRGQTEKKRANALQGRGTSNAYKENANTCDEDANTYAEDAVYDRDPSKLILCAEGHSGKWLSDRLREKFHLELEMAAGGYAIALTSVADREEGFTRLLEALRDIDEEIKIEIKEAKIKTAEKRAATKIEATEKKTSGRIEAASEAKTEAEIETAVIETAHKKILSLREISQNIFQPGEQVYTLGQADMFRKERVDLARSVGRICAEYLYLYPPGVPVAVPGECIRGELIEWVEACREVGLTLQGLSDYSARTILVCEEACR